jgi:hypothetical protein
MEVTCCACNSSVPIYSGYSVNEIIEEHINKRHTTNLNPQSLNYKFKVTQVQIEQNKVRTFLREKIQKRLGGILP